MPDYADHRAHLETLLRSALRAADPAQAVRRAWPALNLEGARRIFVVGAGKAGAAMGRAAAELLGPRLAGGVIAVPREPDDSPPGLRFIAAGHPRPDAGSLAAGQAIAGLLSTVTEDDAVLALLSGGGSALLERPVPGLGLEELGALSAGLMRAGADIDSLNCVRKHLSLIKGGGLARLAAPARLEVVLLSDVIGDRPDVIASGPAAPDPTTVNDARAILERCLPPETCAAMAPLLRETLKPGDPIFARVTHHLAGSNRLAREAAAAAARELGFIVEIVEGDVQGEARLAGARLAAQARAAPSGPRAWVLGGETTVTVTGGGSGGRNHELALAAALALEGETRPIVIASAGTDGLDGSATSAGAWATTGTCRRARAVGLRPEDYLANNDSYTIFEALGDCFHTGPTGTNVNDLILALIYS